MILCQHEQRTEGWFEDRRGVPSASSSDRFITPGGDPSKQCEWYLNILIAEGAGLQGTFLEKTEWMERGEELEDEARAYYQVLTGHSLQVTGFILNDAGTAGCSPDAIRLGDWVEQYDDDLGIMRIHPGPGSFGYEVKNPKPSTHVGYLRAGVVPKAYLPQINTSMAVTNLRKWIFHSHCPGLDPFIRTIEWSDYTDKVKAALDVFIEKLAQERKRLGMPLTKEN